MNSKDTINQLWEEFKKNIKYNNRYFPKNEELIKKLHEMLDDLTKYSSGHSLGDFTVFRARIGEYNKEEDIRKPNPEKVYIEDGRCNPRGISYFYVASEEETAIHETRPQINDIVSVGRFKNNDSLRISNLNSINLIEEELFHRTIISDEERVLLDILLNEISKPINQKKQSLDYIPIQYLVEYIKQYSKENSFDGFSFKSSFNTGINYVFFDDVKFDYIDIKHVKISNLAYKYYKL